MERLVPRRRAATRRPWKNAPAGGRAPPMRRGPSTISRTRCSCGLDAADAACSNADRVKMACLAQLVNVIAPIMTRRWRRPHGAQTTYWPHAARVRLRPRHVRCAAVVDSPVHDCTGPSISAMPPTSSRGGVWSGDDGTKSPCSAVNREPDGGLRRSNLDLRGFGALRPRQSTSCSITPDVKAVNTAEHSAVTPKLHTDRTEGDGNLYKANLTKTSWNVLRFVK